ncbi:MAG: hypothetical protein P8M11_15880, partial [Planctomycetota bacterium]|nr:hypothetical protein [Planctomycetota bacterium]
MMPIQVLRDSRSRAPLRALALGAALVVGACGPGGTVEIDGRRTSEKPSLEVKLGAGVTERLPLRQAASAPSAAPPTDPARGSAPSGAELAAMFEYTVPDGWDELPPTQFRIINLRVPAEPQPAEVSLTMLMGDGGGVRANIDRWRRQVGLSPMTQEEFRSLGERTLFDQPATYVELEGSYEGMDGTRISNAGLFGAVFARGQSALFVKMTGPADLLEAQRSAYLGFLDSLALAERPPVGPGTGVEPGAGAPPSSLTWVSPDGWTEEPSSSPYREVTFRKGAVEMYISVARGGVLANVNRWAGQLGLAPLDQGGLDALERVPMLGLSATIFDGVGAFQGRRDPAPKPDQRMLAAIVESGGVIVTLKATGP